jgi:hypothetical protein
MCQLLDQGTLSPKWAHVICSLVALVVQTVRAHPQNVQDCRVKCEAHHRAYQGHSPCCPMMQIIRLSSPAITPNTDANDFTLPDFAGSRSKAFSDLYEFEPGEEESKWNLLQTPQAPPARARHVAFAVDENHMLIFGGVDKRNRFDDTWIFNCQTKLWTKLEPTGCVHKDEQGIVRVISPGARAHFAAAQFFNTILVYGGYGGAGVVYGDLWALHVNLEASDCDKLRYASRDADHAHFNSKFM